MGRTDGEGQNKCFFKKVKEQACREKIVCKNGTKISRHTFLTLDVDIANNVYKDLINVR